MLKFLVEEAFFVSCQLDLNPQRWQRMYELRIIWGFTSQITLRILTALILSGWNFLSLSLLSFDWILRLLVGQIRCSRYFVSSGHVSGSLMEVLPSLLINAATLCSCCCLDQDCMHFLLQSFKSSLQVRTSNKTVTQMDFKGPLQLQLCFSVSCWVPVV